MDGYFAGTQRILPRLKPNLVLGCHKCHEIQRYFVNQMFTYFSLQSNHIEQLRNYIKLYTYMYISYSVVCCSEAQI